MRDAIEGYMTVITGAAVVPNATSAHGYNAAMPSHDVLRKKQMMNGTSPDDAEI